MCKILCLWVALSVYCFVFWGFHCFKSVYKVYSPPTVAFYRLKGIHIYTYLDICMVQGTSHHKILYDVQFTVSLIQNLGFTLNLSRSDLLHSHSIVILSCHLISSLMTAFLNSGKIMLTNYFLSLAYLSLTSAREILRALRYIIFARLCKRKI